jgi:hypothetical protein
MNHKDYIGLKSMSSRDYHAAPGISSSNLALLSESALHLDNKDLFKNESEAFNFGSLVHSLVLEPHKTMDEFIVMPSLDGRTKEGKAAKAEFESMAEGKVIVSAGDFTTAERMASNVLAIAGGLFQNGVAEHSFFADDDDLLIKARPDYYIEQAGVLVDVKTTSDISEFGIRKSITNYRYHWSASWYMRVLNTLSLPAKKFIFVFVDKAAPHMVKIRELTPNTLESAHYEIESMLDKYRAFKATGKADIVKEIAIFGEQA